jgi:DNA polymerase
VDWLAGAKERAAAAPTDALNAAPDRRARATTESKSVTPGIAKPLALAGGDRERWPATLEDFAGWWLTEPTLDDAPAARRVAPAGPKQAPLMVLVDRPDEGDDAQLLAGRMGKLLDAFLGAAGLSRDRIYLASALPSRVAVPDWQTIAARGLGAVLAHHIALAAPQRLLVFGRAGSSTLLGHDPAHKDANSPFFNHDGLNLAVLTAYDLETLLAKPALKARLWHSWLEWTGTEPL